MTLDGDAAAEGTVWALPGTHRVIAEADLVAVEEHVACSAGATYRIALRPKARAKDATSAPTPPPPSKGLHRAVFFTGLGATAVLAGVTVGMGLDAMAAKRALPRDGVDQAQIDDVLGRARRTDFLLLGAGIAAIATTAIGVWWTDWKGVKATATPVPGGAMITASGGFRGL